MTGPEDSHSSTRPISVAELLAKNGTIGAPPVGGRRRRRRGNTEAVTVAELTGEIPIITDDTHRATAAAKPATDELEEVRDDFTGRCRATDVDRATSREKTRAEARRRDRPDPLKSVDEAAPDADEEADYAAHIEERDAEPLVLRAAAAAAALWPRSAALSAPAPASAPSR